MHTTLTSFGPLLNDYSRVAQTDNFLFLEIQKKKKKKKWVSVYYLLNWKENYFSFKSNIKNGASFIFEKLPKTAG